MMGLGRGQFFFPVRGHLGDLNPCLVDSIKTMHFFPTHLDVAAYMCWSHGN